MMPTTAFDLPGEDAVADQAEGLRRMFPASAQTMLALVSNPHVADSGVAVERMTASLAALGRRVLVLDAGELSPPVSEAAVLGLGACIDRLSPHIHYLAGRGLPRRFVNTRGSATRLVDELSAAVPSADTLLVHASAAELARLFDGRLLRPILLAADDSDSVKHAYASVKLLRQRRGWVTFDLFLLASRAGLRARHIAESLAGCAERFAGLALHDWVVVDPKVSAVQAPGSELLRWVRDQLSAGEDAAATRVAVARRADESRVAMRPPIGH
jgi:flagellar biosynthesis protein FlhG